MRQQTLMWMSCTELRPSYNDKLAKDDSSKICSSFIFASFFLPISSPPSPLASSLHPFPHHCIQTSTPPAYPEPCPSLGSVPERAGQGAPGSPPTKSHQLPAAWKGGGKKERLNVEKKIKDGEMMQEQRRHATEERMGRDKRRLEE